jgi:tetratricopeptide (TPR) repeat protein
MAHSMSARPGAKHAGSRNSSNGHIPERILIGAVPPQAAGFTGRLDMAGGISDTLVPGSSVVLVPGSTFAEGERNWLGASGKTQLAAYAASSLWHSGAVDLLVWINAASRVAVLSGYLQAMATASGIEPSGTAESIAARFVSWLSGISKSWLVVLDDLPDVTELEGLWPAGPAGRTLVTTPRVPSAFGRTARVLPVGLYSVREALSCVTERLNTSPAQRQGAIDLIETAGREPLALAQACAVMESSGMSCREYREFLVRRRQQLGVVPGEVPSAAAATWTLSLDHAEMLLPGDAIRLVLVLIALLDGHAIPGAVFSSAALVAYAGGRVWDAVQVLERAGLVTVDRAQSPPTVRMSLAVQKAVLAAAPASWRDRAARAAADALLEIWPTAEPQAWTADTVRANATALRDAAGEALVADGCHPVLVRAGCSLDDARLTGPAIDHWRKLAAYTDRNPGHLDAAAIAGRLAAAYLAAGQGAEAAAWYRPVLVDRMRVLVPGDPGITQARAGLGRALVRAGQPGDAVTVLAEAVGEYERSRGAGHGDTLASLDDLGAAYLAMGKVTDAVKILNRNVSDRERLSGARDPATMATREQLAVALLADGDVKGAIAQAKRVLTDREAVLGKTHVDTIAARATLATSFQAAGRMPAALQASERACVDSGQVLGTDHPDTLSRQLTLALLYYTVGRVGDAVKLLHDIDGRSRRVLPEGDPLIQAITQSLTNIDGT